MFTITMGNERKDRIISLACVCVCVCPRVMYICEYNIHAQRQRVINIPV
jgi:hypothetical protein